MPHAADPPVYVAKFGGTSVGTPERVHAVVDLVAAMQGGARRVVVSSAFGGVTDRLLAAIEAAKARSGEHAAILDEIRARHTEALEALAPAAERGAREADLAALFDGLAELLQGVYLLRECTPRFQDAIISAGERLSVPLVAAAFRSAGHDAIAIDATEVVRTDDAFGEAAVDFETTRRLVQSRFREIPPGTIAVVTGFVASTEEGVTTTLGRSGSDYTATILGAALDAEEVVIWTDVDGVLSADPRIAPEAFTLDHLSYREAAELAHFGAKVLHPRTMRPLEEAKIPLRIKNTLNPDAPGTLIVAEPPPSPAAIRAVTAVRDAALVRLDGAGIIGVPDLTARVFETLAAAELPVLLIAQASSEGSLCFAVRNHDRERAVRALDREFERECARGDLRGIRALPDLAVVAGVGQGMSRTPGLAGRMFATLGRAHVNVLAIAEGASEHNLSAVVADVDAVRAVDALHEAFALRRLRAHVVLVGVGTIGRRLLALLSRQAEDLLDRQRLNLRLVGIADSRRVAWDEGGIGFDAALDRLEEEGSAGDSLDALSERIASAHLERLVVVDATAAESVARRYPKWLRAGAGVVTPNKQANTLSLEFYAEVRDAARAGEAPFLYETTVGAGLSVISTLRDLLRTGDRIRRIEGVLSGTLAFVLNAMRAGASFSAAVRRAADAGYTEPDPRADLSGADVGRKLVTLAREMGLDAEAAETESLVPEALRDVPLPTFWERLPEADAAWRERLAEAEARGEEVQVVSHVSADGLRTRVQALPPDSPFAGLQGAANVVAFHTDRYAPASLVVQGPGASAEITTSVLLADIARAAEAMR